MSGLVQVIGLGPGDTGLLAPTAREAIEAADIILGYKTYLKLIADIAPNIPRQASGMRKEVERARQALELAVESQRVVVVSSGDAGIYGMAGLVLEICLENEYQVEVEVIPGISALNAAASLLGAPLVTDFAVISLSDQLVPLAEIKKRLEAVAQTDFILGIYNPKGKQRLEPFNQACEILLRYRKPQTPVGIVRQAYRKDQQVTIISLKELPQAEIDMLTILIIGNQQTVVQHGKMITRRGYHTKYKF